MLKLLLKLVLLPPGLLKAHAQGYADLASQAWAQHWCTLKNRWVLWTLGALSLLLALVFAGVALLLWSALPRIDARHAWVLWAWPAGWLGISGLFWFWGLRLRPRPILGGLKEQLRLDMQMIRKAQAS